MYDGKLRNYISGILKKRGLNPLSIISKNAIIYDRKLIGEGFLAIPICCSQKQKLEKIVI